MHQKRQEYFESTQELITWKFTGRPESPVLDYPVRVREKDESDWWKNRTRFQTKDSSQMCVVNDLRSGTVYVQIAARNVVGYSPLTKTEAQTKKEAGNSRFHYMLIL